MFKDLRESIEELQKSRTGKEIAGALSEYFQLVKDIAIDCTDDTAVADLRANEPDLDFMDDDELEEILEQARAIRHMRRDSKQQRRAAEDSEARPAEETDQRAARREEIRRRILEETRRRNRAEAQAIELIAKNEHAAAAKCLAALDDRLIKSLYQEYWDSWEAEGEQ